MRPTAIGAVSAATVLSLSVLSTAGPAPAAAVTEATTEATTAATTAATGAVFVNELHYDNSGTDTGEFVELAGPAGTDLSGWSLVLYNGTTPSAATAYDTRALGGVIPDQQGGQGTLAFDYPVNGIQNGTADGVALVDDASSVVQLLSYEGTFTAADGPAAGATSTDIGVAQTSTTPAGTSLGLTGVGTAYDAFTWQVTDPATPGSPNTGQTLGEGSPPPSTGVCGDPATRIHQVQGDGPAFDPAYGGTQTVEGAITAAMLGGIFVQEEPADVDADAATSEGIFVYLGADPAPAVGEQVRVTGTVSEYGGQTSKTQLSGATVAQCGPGAAVPPAPVTFPLSSPGELEQYEGMSVQLVDDLVISEYFNFDRYGETVLALPPNGWDRLYTPTAVVEPGPQAQALADDYATRRIVLDDASTQQNPSSIPHPGNGAPFSLDNRFRGGDTVTGVVGVVDHAFGSYRLQPTQYGTYTAANPRPGAAPPVGGAVHVASFNVLNYFLTLDDGTPRCGPQGDQECRGADDAQELQRQRDKILSALATMDADVVGLMEMENSPGVEPAADLAAGLNQRLGAGTYDYVDTGVVGSDAIRVGFLYKPGTVRPVGDFEVLDASVDPRFDTSKNRPMLTQTFDQVGGGRFTVSVNHLKSKGSSCDALGDPDTGDGQGNCNQTRTEAARAIVDFLATDPTGSGDPDHLVIGDLNSYDHEDPVDALRAGGFEDQVGRFGGELAHGYVFDGQAGYLDHALASASLAPQVTGAQEWHINADEPDILDYDTSFKPDAVDAIYAPDPYRSSDHDAVVVGIDPTPAQAAHGRGKGKSKGRAKAKGKGKHPTEATGASPPAQ